MCRLRVRLFAALVLQEARAGGGGGGARTGRRPKCRFAVLCLGGSGRQLAAGLQAERPDAGGNCSLPAASSSGAAPGEARL